jgi:hypothetical protein
MGDFVKHDGNQNGERPDRDLSYRFFQRRVFWRGNINTNTARPRKTQAGC